MCASIPIDPRAGLIAPEIEERAAGALLGAAVGDALGAPVEFMSAHEIKEQYGVHREMSGGGWLHLKPGQVTDDTEMSLCIARAFVSAGGCRPHEMMRRFVEWLDGGPVDVGSTCLAGIERYRKNGRVAANVSKLHGGNGALMRMAPVALFTLGDDDALLQCAKVQAHLTHNHPLSDAACIAVGRMVQRALLGGGGPELRAVADEAARLHPPLLFDPYPAKTGGFVANTFSTACHDLFSTEDFQSCLLAVVNRGGDSDTNAAVAGMVAGALYGKAGIPEAWLAALDPATAAELESLARRLVSLSPHARSLRLAPDLT